MSFTQDEILKQLDECAVNSAFPFLDNAYVFLAAGRLCAYADNNRWAIIIEILGYGVMEHGHSGINNMLYVYGNCTRLPPGIHNDCFLYPTSDSEDGPTFDNTQECNVNPNVHSFLLKRKTIPISHDPEFYAAKAIILETPGKVRVFEFLRGLLPEYYDDLMATDEELFKFIPGDLKMLLSLKEWKHCDITCGEMPGESATFKMIADVLVSKKSSLYVPEKPNTHWSNWLQSGKG